MSKKLKEWEKHIKNTHIENTTYCGEGENDFEFKFMDIDHAANEIQRGGRLLPCPACVKKIITILKNE